MAFINQTGAVLTDASGRLVSPGAIQIHDQSQLPTTVFAVEGCLSGLNTPDAVAVINSLQKSDDNVALLRAIMMHSNQVPLVNAAIAQLTAWDCY